jgi:Secretion system C-terminal sorting domain
MKHFYSNFFRTLLLASLISYINQANAQNPTTVVSSNTCTVVQNFNDGLNTNFTSPSIYSDQYDYEFDWTNSGGNGMMVSSSQATLVPYETSLISQAYLNSAPDGTVSVGFTYSAPPGTLYRIRVIRPGNGAGDIMAITSQGQPIIGGVPNWAPLPAGSGTLCLQLLDADLHPNQNYRYEFTFYVTANTSRVTFDDFALSSSAPGSLPATFLGIVADRSDNGIKVRWDVGDEINVLRYEVEKSTDARSFSSIGTVDANKKKVYGYTDANIKAEEIFYRIKSVDIDGTVKYSGIVRFKNNTSSTGKLLVYPSPVNNLLTIEHEKLSTNGKLIVSTIDGRILKTIRPNAGISNTMIDVSSFSSGMYILKFDDGKGRIQTSTFVKQ